MTRRYLISILLLCSSLNAFAQQTSTDTLRVEQKFFGVDYYVGAREISHEEFVRLLGTSPDSSVLADYSGGKNTLVLANAFGFAGGFCVGYGLSSDPTNTVLVVAGAVAIVAGIIIESRATSQMERAIQNYNRIESRRQTTSYVLPPRSSSITFTMSLAF